MNKLTPIQCKVLEFIIKQIEDKMLPPTHRDISGHFKWSSNAAAKCHLLALEKKKFIHVIPYISRGIVITPEAREWMMLRKATA